MSARTAILNTKNSRFLHSLQTVFQNGVDGHWICCCSRGRVGECSCAKRKRRVGQSPVLIPGCLSPGVKKVQEESAADVISCRSSTLGCCWISMSDLCVFEDSTTILFYKVRKATLFYDQQTTNGQPPPSCSFL